MAKKMQIENHKDDFSKKQHDKVSLWMRHGIEDVYFQRDVSVTFWTVLGGISVAALLTQVNILIEKIVQGQWYFLFYFLTSIALIVNSWAQYTWGSIVLRIPVTIMHTLLIFMNLLFLSIACLQVTSPVFFFLIIAIYIMFGLLLNLYLMKAGAWIHVNRERIKGIKIINSIYLLFMFLCFLAAAHINYYSSTTTEAGWSIFALIASSCALVLQNSVMRQERKELGIP